MRIAIAKNLCTLGGGKVGFPLDHDNLDFPEFLALEHPYLILHNFSPIYKIIPPRAVEYDVSLSLEIKKTRLKNFNQVYVKIFVFWGLYWMQGRKMHQLGFVCKIISP